jgi:hypothetical protein
MVLLAVMVRLVVVEHIMAQQVVKVSIQDPRTLVLHAKVMMVAMVLAVLAVAVVDLALLVVMLVLA